MRTMALRYWVLGVVAVLLAALFVRLGIWQLDRLGQRRAVSALRAERRAAQLLDLASSLPAGGSLPDSLRWRRFEAAGSWDFDREVVVRGRSHHGSPGIYVATPLLLDATAAVLVVRGWLPAADGLRADLAAGRAEQAQAGGLARAVGIALPPQPTSPLPVQRVAYDGREHLVVGSLRPGDLSGEFPYQLSDFILQAFPPDEAAGRERVSAAEARLPRPVPPAELGDGPHLLYAVQWFSFAVISLVGAGAYIRSRSAGSGARARVSRALRAGPSDADKAVEEEP